MKLYNFVKRDQLAESEICMPIIARYGTGGGNTPLVLMENDMSYQNRTGTLSPGAHAGRYNGQDAYNDMLVTNYELCASGVRSLQGNRDGISPENEGLQGCNGSHSRRGGY